MKNMCNLITEGHIKNMCATCDVVLRPMRVREFESFTSCKIVAREQRLCKHFINEVICMRFAPIKMKGVYVYFSLIHPMSS